MVCYRYGLMIAHVKPEGENFETQSYQDHALGVAELCRAFAGGLTRGKKWQDLGYIIGLLHDFGKLQESFQRYIRSASGMSEQAAPRVHHSATGALFVEQYLQDPRLVEVVRYCITGHHRGLYDYHQMQNRLKHSEEKALLEKAKQNAPREVEWSIEQLQEALASVSKKRLISPKDSDEEKDHPMLVRMLFSCLVDADALDTELFMDAAKAHKRYSMPTADFSFARPA